MSMLTIQRWGVERGRKWSNYMQLNASCPQPYSRARSSTACIHDHDRMMKCTCSILLTWTDSIHFEQVKGMLSTKRGAGQTGQHSQVVHEQRSWQQVTGQADKLEQCHLPGRWTVGGHRLIRGDRIQRAPVFHSQFQFQRVLTIEVSYLKTMLFPVTCINQFQQLSTLSSRLSLWKESSADCAFSS